VAECDALAKKYCDRFTPPKLPRDMAAKGETFYKAPAAARSRPHPLTPDLREREFRFRGSENSNCTAATARKFS
jgi:hypothetical protein